MFDLNQIEFYSQDVNELNMSIADYVYAEYILITCSAGLKGPTSEGE